MDDAVGTLQGARHGGRVTHIAIDELDLRRQALGQGPAGARAGMHLFDQRVEHPHRVAAIKQSSGDVAADEAGATGNQDSVHGCLVEIKTTPCLKRTSA